MDRRTVTRLAVLGAGVLGLTACGAAGAVPGSGTPAAAPLLEGFPLETENCGEAVTITRPPERVVLLESAPVTVLESLGVLDRVVAIAGSFPAGYYPEELAARIREIPVLSQDIDLSGHLMITQEVVIAQSPDLVLGLPDGVAREALAGAGAQVLVHESLCATGEEPASFEDLDAILTLYGAVFDRRAEAEQAGAGYTRRIEQVRAAAQTAPRRRGAVLYPSAGGGPLYAYGAASMAHPQLDAVGLDNVFAGIPERVFEVSAEALIDADPEVLVLLHQGEGDGAELVEELLQLGGLDELSAVRSGSILPMLFNFTEPASPLVVDGTELLHGWLTADGGPA